MQPGFDGQTKLQPKLPQDGAVAEGGNASGYAPRSKVLKMGKARLWIMKNN